MIERARASGHERGGPGGPDAERRDEAGDAGPSLGGLRWPWALLAAGLGAAGGAAVALIVRSQLQDDAPGAQEPHELRAVVDRPAPELPTS